MKILIIDDDIDALRILQKILTKENHEVEILSQWHDTFSLVKTFQPLIHRNFIKFHIFYPA